MAEGDEGLGSTAATWPFASGLERVAVGAAGTTVGDGRSTMRVGSGGGTVLAGAPVELQAKLTTKEVISHNKPAGFSPTTTHLRLLQIVASICDLKPKSPMRSATTVCYGLGMVRRGWLGMLSYGKRISTRGASVPYLSK